MASSGSQPAIGDVVYLHDRVTGFSTKNVMRWCVVVALVGGGVRVMGRSASRRTGVFTPAGTMSEFDRDGHFWPSSRRISAQDAATARNIGKLPQPYLGQVLAQFRRRRRKT
jgi:hypothetical protein